MNHFKLFKSWQDIAWPDVRRQATLLLPRIALVLLIILLAQTFAKLTWTVFSPGKMLTPDYSAHSLSQTSLQPVLSPPGNNLAGVSQYHLFGEANKQPAVVQQVIDAPDTRLSLTLKGIFAASSQANAIAIISGGRGEDITYHIGDKITGGAILHAVYADRVILRRDGRLETLRLPKPKMEGADITTGSVPAASQLGQSHVDTSSAANKSTPAAKSQGLRKIRDTLLKDPAKVWQDVRINPVMENGNVKGYTLVHDDPDLMKSLNLRPTDIITEVDGQPLSDPATLYGLMNNLAHASSLALTIERDGQQQLIELSF